MNIDSRPYYFGGSFHNNLAVSIDSLDAQGNEIKLDEGADYIIDSGFYIYDGDTGAYVKIAEGPEAGLDCYVKIVANQDGAYRGERYESLSIFDYSDISNWSGDRGFSAVVGTGGFETDSNFYIYAEIGGNEQKLALGKDLEVAEGGYSRYLDEEDKWVEFEGDEPDSAGKYRMEVRPKNPAYSGTAYIYFTVVDVRDMNSWQAELLYDSYLFKNKFVAPEMELYYQSYDENHNLMTAYDYAQGKDYDFGGYYICSEEDEDSREDSSYTKVDGDISQPGTYYAKFVPADGSIYVGCKYVEFSVSDFSDISEWGLRSSTVEIDGDNVEYPDYELYWQGRNDKTHIAKLDDDFTVVGYTAISDNDKEISVEKIDGSYKSYYVVLRGNPDSGFTGEHAYKLYVDNYNDLSKWRVDVSDCYLQDGKLTQPAVTVWRYKVGDDGDKVQLAEGADYEWHWVKSEFSDEEIPTPTESGEYCLAVIPANGSAKTGTIVAHIGIGEKTDLNYGWKAQRKDSSGFGIVKGGLALPVFQVVRSNDTSTALIEGTDYTVTYESLDAAGKSAAVSGLPVKAGRYRAVITGCGSYSGKLYYSFEFKDFLDLANCFIDADDEMYYSTLADGKFVKPEFCIKSSYDYSALEEGVDYTVVGYQKLSDNDIMGKSEGEILSRPAEEGYYRVLLTGIEGGVYHGELQVLLKVFNTVDLGNTTLVDGNRTYFEDSLTFASEGFDLAYSIDGENKRLELGTDYTVKYWWDADTGERLDTFPTSPGSYVARLVACGDTAIGSRSYWFQIYNSLSECEIGVESDLQSDKDSGYFVGKFVANEAGRYVVSATSDHCVNFYADEKMTEWINDEEGYDKGLYSVLLKKGETAWFVLEYRADGGAASASYRIAYEEACVHEYGESAIYDEKPVYSDEQDYAGYFAILKCKICGEEKRLYGDARVVTTKAPTCAAEGERVYTVKYHTLCSGKYIDSCSWTESIAIDAENHTNVVADEAVASTCAAEGKTEGSHCADCGKAIVRQEETERLPHTLGEPVQENEVAATCSTEGSYDEVTYCTVCNEELSREAKAIEKDPDNHAELAKDEAVAPTCTEAGLTEGEHCEACEAVTKAQEAVPAIGHTAGDAVCENEKAATCVAEGSYDAVTYCSACGEELSREAKAIEKDPDNHASVVTDAAKDANYAETGLTEGSHCEDCGETIVEQKVVDKLIPTAIAASQVKLSAVSYTYDGRAKAPGVTISGLKQGTDYTVSYAANTNAGTAKVTVTGIGKYTGTVTKTFTINKAKNAVTAKVAKKTLKVKTLKKKAQSFSIGAKAKGGAKLSYKVTKKASSKISVSKSGKVTLKKGAKKGTYTITVKSKATTNYKATTKTITIKVK